MEDIGQGIQIFGEIIVGFVEEQYQKLRGKIKHSKWCHCLKIPFQYSYNPNDPYQQYPNPITIQNGIYYQIPNFNMNEINSFNSNNNNINNNFINNNNYNNNINNNFINNNHNYNNFINQQTNKLAEHLRGLVNIASTCYMNSTLQCFAHVKELFAYFQKPKIQQIINLPENDTKLFPVFVELITVNLN